MINELLSTDNSLIPSSKHYVFAYTAREIRKQNMAWIKAWILTALNCIDTEASRDRARDISKARPIRLNMKRKAITKEICTQRDRKRMKSLKLRLKNKSRKILTANTLMRYSGINRMVRLLRQIAKDI